MVFMILARQASLKSRCAVSGIRFAFGAGRGNRTPMVSPPRDFESRASTNSAIPAAARIIREMGADGNFENLLRLAECYDFGHAH